jgi:hypothetical protein
LGAAAEFATQLKANPVMANALVYLSCVRLVESEVSKSGTLDANPFARCHLIDV